LNKPLWLAQRDVLASYTTHEIEISPEDPLPQTQEACIVYRDNLYFDADYLKAFLAEATKAPARLTGCFHVERCFVP